MPSITQLARAELRDLIPYQSARSIGGAGEVWLNANEAPTAPDIQAACTALNRYPEPQPQQVLAAYARYAQVPAENVLITRGGDEGIELLVRAFCQPGSDALIYCPPTYGMYAVSAAANGVSALTVPQRANFQLDLPAIAHALDSQPVKLIFICNPNNPSGTRLNRADLDALLAMTRGRAIVVIDEAYIEYSAADTLAGELPRQPHLALIRTLSKAHALAGIRCGFVLANPELIGLLAKIIAPYPIPTPVADIAAQALSAAGLAQMRQRVADTLAERAALQAALQQSPLVREVYASAANFLLARFSDGPAVFNALWQRGIILRSQENAHGLANCIRITVGSHAENDTLIRALRQLEQTP